MQRILLGGVIGDGSAPVARGDRLPRPSTMFSCTEEKYWIVVGFKLRRSLTRAVQQSSH